MTTRVPLRLSGVVLGALMLVCAACSSTPAAVSTDSLPGGAPSATSKPKASTTTTEDVSSTDPTTDPTTDVTTKTVKGTTTLPKKATTTVPVKATPAEFGQAAVEAFKAKIGDFKGLELTVNFNGASNRAALQAQDPAKPANVDAYEYTGGAVGGPDPVKLTGSGDLEANLFAVNDIAWEKLPDLFEQATSAIGDLEGSKGVTHFIVKKNLPFDNDTVINIYVDGGTRSDGGYVSFQANGTLKKVFGPSK